MELHTDGTHWNGTIPSVKMFKKYFVGQCCPFWNNTSACSGKIHDFLGVGVHRDGSGHGARGAILRAARLV